jgi:hypothetical protein
MGLYITLKILKQEDLTLDIVSLNNELKNNSDFNDLFEDAQKYNNEDYFKLINNELKLACNMDGYFEGYQNYTRYYGGFHDEAEIISKHLKTGKLVFKLNIEGNPDEYFVITPNTVIYKSDKDLF